MFFTYLGENLGAAYLYAEIEITQRDLLTIPNHLVLDPSSVDLLNVPSIFNKILGPSTTHRNCDVAKLSSTTINKTK